MPARALLLAIALAASFWIAQVAVYEPLLVPRLTNYHEVPILIWALVLLPEVIVCIMAAATLRKNSSLALFALLGGLLLALSQFLAGALNRPAHSKVVEGGWIHFLIQFGIVTLALALVALVARVVLSLLRRAK